MAFRKDKTGAAQTAANSAAVLVSAFADSFDSFESAVEAYNELREATFEDLAAVVDADNEVFAAAEKGERSNGSSSRRSNGKASSSSSKSRSRKTSGGSSRKGGKSSITLDDALSLELNFGAFEGETLETVLGLDADTADDEYGYGDGERDGRDYIAWLASDKNKNEFVQRRARIIADEEGIEYDD
jgi:hypothetical protein